MVHGATGFLALLGLNSFLAFFVNLSNFLVTKHTSALTLQARLRCPDPACRLDCPAGLQCWNVFNLSEQCALKALSSQLPLCPGSACLP